MNLWTILKYFCSLKCYFNLCKLNRESPSNLKSVGKNGDSFMLFNKKTFFILTIIIFATNAFVFSQSKANDSKLQKDLIGIWQATPSVASGMNDNFQFFADGKFRFNYNQMVFSKRTISYSGTWQVLRGSLILQTTERTDIVGGKKVKSEMSADGYEIDGGQIVNKKVSPAEKQTLALGFFKPRANSYPRRIIGKRTFWKLSDDPKAFED